MVTMTEYTEQGELRRIAALALCDLAIMQTGLAPSAVGIRACADPRFVFDLRQGRRPREDTFLRTIIALATIPTTSDRGRGLEP